MTPMDEVLSGNGTHHQDLRRLNTVTEGEAARQLRIDTVVTPRTFCGDFGSTLEDASDDGRSTGNGLADGSTEKKQAASEHMDHHLRLRALSESDHYQLQSGIGMQIPHTHAQRSNPLSPPMSYSPVSIPSNSLYSTSAHLYSSDEHSLPDTPQSSITSLLESKRHPKPARASLGPHINRTGHNRRTTGDGYGLNRSVTYSYGSREDSYIDASSFESVPDSPAKMFLQGFAQATTPIPMPDDAGQEIGSYIIGRVLGVGGFSIVKEAVTHENGRQVCHAVKIVRKHAVPDESSNERLQSHFEHEINVWKCVSNPYILPLLDVIDTSYATWAFTLLFAGGTLFDAFKSYRQGLPPQMTLKYSYQLASALRYLHQDARIVHRDVKLENCVLDKHWDEGGNLRLCDFGLADFLPGDDTPSPRQQFTTPQPHGSGNPHHSIRPEDMVAGGSLAYAAPEQIRSTVPLLDTGIDVWSYGVVVHALTIGELPFYDPLPVRLQDRILRNEWNKDRFSGRVDSEISEVVLNCLETDSTKRWDIMQVLESQWLSLYKESSNV